MWLEVLRGVLKIISLIGLMATGPMMVAVTYKKVKERYPSEVKKYKWLFWVMSIVLSVVFLAIFLLLFPDRPTVPGGILRSKYKIFGGS